MKTKLIPMRLITMLAGASLFALTSAAHARQPAVTAKIQAKTLPAVRKIDERFQSFQIGMSHLTSGETWKAYDGKAAISGPSAPGDVSAVREARPAADLSSARLRTLTAALGPFYLRYSGTTANSVYFQDDDQPKLTKAPHGFSVVLTRADWKRGLDFAKAVDAKVLTGFAWSAGVRDSAGAWTPRMAEPWLAYTKSVGGELYAAELGNEPNAPEPPHYPKGHTPEDYARDFALFRTFMKQAAPEVKLAGPSDATLGVPIPSIDHVSAEQYLSADPRPQIDILSYHFYAALAERCAPANSPVGISAENALSDDWLSRPDKQFQRHKALRDKFAPQAPIWISETGAAACGGTKWQPSFLDTFRFLDTQARLAKQGVDALFTHALISGSNGVIDEKTYMPNADYWAALLWRRTMGTQVLDAGPTQPGLHIYAHCQRGVSGGVTLLAIHTGSSPANIDLKGPIDLYALTSTALESRTVLLNGRAMVLAPDDSLPKISPQRVKGGRVTLSPTSVNFITLPKVNNPSCRI